MSKIGRPKKITKEVLQKLEEGFLKGLSDREACIYANIGLSTLYDYCNNHKEFSERKELLKDAVKMHAKINLANKIEQDKDISMSLWYLERKCKDDFSPKQEIAHSGAVNINNPFEGLTTEELKKLVESG